MSELDQQYPAQKLIDTLLRRYYYQELLGLDENDEPRTKPTGLKGAISDYFAMDEVLSWMWEKPEPITFTPAQFNRMWNGLSHNQKVAYVRALLV